ncbi:hypothetical protein [Nocardia sp. NPDC056000]|uniref:hypothetical protein n=1 Tax=Nocardia sp. NPDC056000 TaxID=3345674 RepID=UPI0035E19C54
MKRKMLAWFAVLAGCAGLGLCTWQFITIGLDGASKLAGVLSFFAGLLSLAVAVCGLLLTRPSAKHQSIANSAVGGSISQIGRINGKVVLRQTGSHSTSPLTPPPSSTGTSTSEQSGSQSITSSTAGGSLNQIAEAGELEVEQ